VNILTNHIGYEIDGRKTALIAGEAGEALSPGAEVFLINTYGARSVHDRISLGAPGPRTEVQGWKGRFFHKIDFSEVKEAGRYKLRLRDGEGIVETSPFTIESGLLADSCISDVLFYFKSQRAGWRWDKTDRHVGFFGGRPDKVDVHGGWYDAAGDYSKYLSHLSYANHMNPQQSPLVVWALFELKDSLAESSRYGGTLLEERGLEEALYGSDFLMRMQDPEGYFYITLFDQWSKENEKRMISAFRGKEGIRMDNYQAGFRQGGGMAIAALARAARCGFSGKYETSDYLQAALHGWNHLLQYGTEYLDNGRENIIDVYCALMAANELFKTTREQRFLAAAEERAGEIDRLYDRQQGYWRMETNSQRPYFHAAEAGLPIVALTEYLKISEASAESRARSEQLVSRAVQDLLTVTSTVENPFLLARQWVKSVDSEVRKAFFIPHSNESGYWWQGENARLASLACAARRAKPYYNALPGESSKKSAVEKEELDEFADAQLHWILGRNPYDMCMLQGHGRNNPRYEEFYPNAPGGICNGITAGYADEGDIDFLPPEVEGRGDHRWRWSEQWIPHAAWFLLAIAADSERWKH